MSRRPGDYRQDLPESSPVCGPVRDETKVQPLYRQIADVLRQAVLTDVMVIVIKHSWHSNATTGPWLAARGERRGGAFRIDATTVDNKGPCVVARVERRGGAFRLSTRCDHDPGSQGQ
jgi:hypothetical protein